MHSGFASGLLRPFWHAVLSVQFFGALSGDLYTCGHWQGIAHEVILVSPISLACVCLEWEVLREGLFLELQESSLAA